MRALFIALYDRVWYIGALVREVLNLHGHTLMYKHLVIILAFIALPGCRAYKAVPLIPKDIILQIDQQRQVDLNQRATSTKDQFFTFNQALVWLRKHSPAVKESVAQYQTALTLARIKTPLPNPVFVAGPQLGFGSDVSSVNQLAPLGSIGWTIPLNKRLQWQDEVNKSRAEWARINAVARFRELYLDLRDHYSALAIADRRMKAIKQVNMTIKSSLEACKYLVKAGLGTSLDTALLELEYRRSQIEILNASRTIDLRASSLSALIGVHSKLFKVKKLLPTLPVSVPTMTELKKLLINNHTRLARLRAQYEVTESILRLEMSKRVPDLQVGSSFENEVGEKKTVFGLTLGVELPLFDRNQQAIASAEKRRDACRVGYEAEANRALAKLQQASITLVYAIKSRQFLSDNILPKAQANVELARRSAKAGLADALRLLEAGRSVRKIQLEVLEAELEERRAWIKLEKAIGYPLMKFPSEKAGKAAEAPEELKEKTTR
jgi:outer membrane protein, heavy metal efflux system